MATPVEAPKLGNTVEECLVSQWRKRKGDLVSAGDVVVEIETDKAAFEVAAPVGGMLLATFFDEGALVPVYTNLFVIGEPGEDVEAYRPGAVAPGPKGAPSASGGLSAEQEAPLTPKTPPAETGGATSPRARRFAEERGLNPAGVPGSGPGGRVLENDLRKLYDSTPRVSSAARQRLEEGAEFRGEGSGAAGRILAADLGPPAAPLSRIRATIARRMRESLATTAQYTLHASANAASLLALRKRIKDAAGGPDITIGDLVAFCAVKALLEFPDVNAEFIGGKIYRRPEIHLGFACDTPRGLMVPVVRNAHQLDLAELALRMKELAAQALGGGISADDLSGGTFTISNLGGLGIESFTPLLNPPQVAVLGVDAIQVKPVRRGSDGAVVFIDSIGLSLTCDHQVVDGAPGARFLQAVKNKIENVETLCTI
ncbi:MAG: dihydrolipoamide acetyltransferase family protein [Bryobacteraceae bacterium]|jgi:pyruvate dehydrogenase E2 component (dihydrolipoamide acetyltransferase)